MREFHISRQSRDRYQFDQSLFSFNGNVIFANFHAARTFTQKINDRRDLMSFPENALKPGQVNAMGLIDEILHFVLDFYRKENNHLVMEDALLWVKSRLGEKAVGKALMLFTQEFPPVDVYQKKITSEEYLEGGTPELSNQAIALEELIMLRIANVNPAMQPYQDLFGDNTLQDESIYLEIYKELHAFFDTQPAFGPDHQNLLDMLHAPAVAVPYSLFGQLEYIRTHWSSLLGRYLYRLLISLDFLKEEEARFLGAGQISIPVYETVEGEFEQFSPDKDWMPRLVLIAKNAFVWLDQLSKKYKEKISHLDQIPDAELDALAKSGFTGLWMIGLWERSPASARIKQLCGNPEAISSAYSLSSYSIAADLGGEDAYQNLRQRAWQRGIRLASDMVPNHMGIDSNWMVEHPEWFVSLDYSPFPSYSFNGPNLSNDSRVSIYVEDHYYNRTDAAVVFKRVDNNTGYTQYVYHGNDGTSMPWNDTAQLNYLNPQVREAVIQTILEVTRKSPIIRFDAAMTLAKKHFQRLWFPEPGGGGAIPSRAEHGLTHQQFDAAIPIEFWREVVDRVAKEAPDTLLLAEAFWLMESYFVRTLGMHRVYNSAFMNILRNEENAKYRTVMKNTLEFDPEILKRYVNFMNNPDERTAVDQFGKGDKYFGICVLMATLPGLPMFGHGQVEGYAEKYGMEFRRAYWDEYPDPYLVERHQREIFPLLHRRYLFAGVENFLLYDFFTTDGWVNEDVFAFSNGVGNERGLVVYHNKFADTQGWVKNSVGFTVKNNDQRTVVQRSLSEGLAIPAMDNNYTIFRDHTTNLEYIRPSKEIVEKGIYLELSAYKYHVFLDFRQVQDDEWHSYQHLNSYLSGRGVPSVQEAMQELLLQPVQNPFREIANQGYFKYLLNNQIRPAITPLSDEFLEQAKLKTQNLINGIENLIGESAGRDLILSDLESSLNIITQIPVFQSYLPFPSGKKYANVIKYLQAGFESDPRSRYLVLYSWLFTHNIGNINNAPDFENFSLSWIEEWQFSKLLDQTYEAMGIDNRQAWWMVQTVRALISQQRWFSKSKKIPLHQVLENWLANSDIQSLVGVNRYKDVLWFNQEAYENFIWWMNVMAVIEVCNMHLPVPETLKQILAAYEKIQQLLLAEKESGFKVEGLVRELRKEKE